MCRPKSVDIVYCTDRWDIQTEVEEMGGNFTGEFCKSGETAAAAAAVAPAERESVSRKIEVDVWI
jgi:hypothetical protein